MQFSINSGCVNSSKLGVATQSLGSSRFIGCGNSMGAATALCAALACPERFLALVLYRPPMLWEAREARKEALLEKADSLDGVHRSVLRGAALTNLPSRDDAAWARLKSARVCTESVWVPVCIPVGLL